MKNTSPISNRELVFYRRLRRNRVFSEILGYFGALAKKEGLTKQDLARLLDKDPSQITRWFSEPANLCLDTISDLLVAMGAEMEFRLIPVGAQYTAEELMEDFADWSSREEESARPFPDESALSAKTNNAVRNFCFAGGNGEQSAATS